jgi:hypothetical protein
MIKTKNECDSPFRASFQNIINSITNLNLTSKEKVWSWYEKSSHNARRRTNLSFNSGVTIYLSLIKTNYICSHYNCAYLSMLADLDDLKKELGILNKSVVTIGKPLTFKDSFVQWRDTILLTPAGAGSV